MIFNSYRRHILNPPPKKIQQHIHNTFYIGLTYQGYGIKVKLTFSVNDQCNQAITFENCELRTYSFT